MKKRRVILYAGMLILLTVGSSDAALVNNYTKKSGDNAWGDAGIWALRELPSAANTAQIRKRSSITCDTDAIAGEIRIFEGASLTVTNKGHIVVDDGMGGNNFVIVGYSTLGTLNLSGGTIESARLYLGFTGKAQGTISSGTIKSPLIYVGKAAGSSADITQTGGEVFAANSFNMNYSKGANGIYHFQGGSLTASKMSFRSQSPKTETPFNWTGGTLKTADITFFENWKAKNSTFKQSAGILSPASLNKDGSVNEISRLNIHAAEDVAAGYTLSGTGHLQMQLENAKSYDQLVVSGSFLAGGTLDIVLLDGFKPADGDVFMLMKAAEMAGTFKQVNLPALESGLRWNRDDLLIDGTLSVVAVP